MPSLRRPRALFERVATDSRDTVSALQRDLHRRILFTRLGRLSYEQRGGSNNGGVGAEIDRLVAELTKLEPPAVHEPARSHDEPSVDEPTFPDRLIVTTSPL